jgi:hypothetical protein
LPVQDGFEPELGIGAIAREDLHLRAMAQGLLVGRDHAEPPVHQEGRETNMKICWRTIGNRMLKLRSSFQLLHHIRRSDFG